MSYKKFTKDVFLMGIIAAILALKTLIILPIITKILGAENYGVWTQILVTVSFLSPIVTLGLPFTMVRFLAAEKDIEEIRDGVYSVLTLIFGACLITVSILFISKPASIFLGCPTSLIGVLSLIILFESINLVFLYVFRAFQQIKKYSFFVIFQTFLEIGLVIVAVSLNFGLFGAVVSLLIARLANFILMSISTIYRIGIAFPRFLRIKEYLSFGLPTIPANFSYWVLNTSDRYLIGYFLGTLAVGYYAPGYAIGYCVNLFIGPLWFILPAALSKHFDENRISEVKTYLKYSLKYFLAITIPAIFGLSILSKQLLIIFSTQEIAENGYLVVPFVALSTLFFGIYAIFSQILTLVKKTKLDAKVQIIAAITNIALNIILIPRFGILAAAFTTCFSFFVLALLEMYYSYKELAFEIDWNFIYKSLIASILMSTLVILFSPSGIIKTLIIIVISVVFYFILLLIFKGFEKKEISLLKSLMVKTGL